MRARQEMSGEEVSGMAAAIWAKLIRPPWELIMSGIRSSTAHLMAMESAWLSMYFHISSRSLRLTSFDSIVLISVLSLLLYAGIIVEHAWLCYPGRVNIYRTYH